MLNSSSGGSHSSDHFNHLIAMKSGQYCNEKLSAIASLTTQIDYQAASGSSHCCQLPSRPPVLLRQPPAASRHPAIHRSGISVRCALLTRHCHSFRIVVIISAICVFICMLICNLSCIQSSRSVVVWSAGVSVAFCLTLAIVSCQRASLQPIVECRVSNDVCRAFIGFY